MLPNTFFGKLQPLLFSFWYLCSTSSIENRVKQSKKIAVKTIRRIINLLLKIIPKRFCDKQAQKALRMFENHEAIYVNHLSNGATKIRLKKYLREKSTFYDIIQWNFEGYMLPIPSNYHDVLTRLFGEYMQLPPVEQRNPHHGVIEVVI